MKKFSIFLAIILGISMFAVTSCGSSEPAEKESGESQYVEFEEYGWHSWEEIEAKRKEMEAKKAKNK